MDRLGWAVRLPRAGFAGRYCTACAQLLELYCSSIACAECGTEVEDDNAADHAGWRYFTTGTGTLTPFCAECTEQEFGV